MKKILLFVSVFVFVFVFVTPVSAQYPSWVKKAQKSIFKVVTYSADGNRIGEACGFYTDKNQGVAPYSIFLKATKAIIYDESGKETTVESIISANEMYDLIRFNISNKKATPLTIAEAPAAEGEEIWVVTSPDQATKGYSGKILKTETFKEKYTYYTTSLNKDGSDKANTILEGCPVFNGKGEVISVMQQSANSRNTEQHYSVSAPYAMSLEINWLAVNSEDMRNILIKPTLSDVEEQAFLSMTLAASTLPIDRFKVLVEDFIAKFPKSADGYAARARILVNEKNYDAAETEIQKAYELNPLPMYKNQKSKLYISKALDLIGQQKYRDGVLALNTAEELSTDTLDENFYYVREQAEANSRMFQQALNDLAKLITLNDSNVLYYAEKARVHYIVNQYDEAIETAKTCIKLTPDYDEIHLIYGLALIGKGSKAEGTKELEEAKRLGSPQADKFIQKTRNANEQNE